MTQNVATYCPEVMTLIRAINYQKDLLKEFKETDEGAQEMVVAIKEQQDILKSYLEAQDDSKEILGKIKELETDLKLAVRGAAKGSVYKANQVKAYYIARSKDEGVKKVISKGEVFNELDNIVSK